MQRRRSWAILLGAASLAAATCAGQAAASSIVYLKSGDVYVGSPDGGVERRLTTGGGFESPSQADSGTVVAVKRTEEGDFNRGYIHRMNRSGQPVGTRTRCGPETSTTYTGPLGAEVSPDGSLLAFHFFQAPDASPKAAYCPTGRDALSSEFGEIGGHFNPSWISSSRVALFATSTLPNVITDPPGHPPEYGSEGWFTDGDIRLSAGAADQTLTKFAAIVRGGSELRLYQMNGPPPAAPTAKCGFTFAGATDHYEHPTWSPDGVHVADVPSLDDCSQVTEMLAIPGGRDPHWGPAAAPRAADPGPTPRCVVPKLKGKTLPKAKRALRKARCKLGSVTRRKAARAKAGRVLSQRPKPGSVRPRGAKVRVVVGRR